MTDQDLNERLAPALRLAGKTLYAIVWGDDYDPFNDADLAWDGEREDARFATDLTLLMLESGPVAVRRDPRNPERPFRCGWGGGADPEDDARGSTLCEALAWAFVAGQAWGK